MKRHFLLYCLVILASIPNLHSQTNLTQIKNMQSTPQCYGALKIDVPIQIDGINDEEIWELAPWTHSFVDIEGGSKPIPGHSTRVKMLWDDQYLYLYARMEEPHVWGTLMQRDTIIYHNNDFEVFIKPFDQQSVYYEIEVNPLNTIMDLMMDKPYRFGGDAHMHWDVKGLKSAVYVEGTLNKADDVDQYWAVEMAIPFASLSTFSRPVIPKLNEYWKVNFSRVQWGYDLQDGVYSRKKENNRLLAEDNWVWSPIGIINMHYPERWGYVKFINSTEEVTLPKSYIAEKQAWNIFYLQQQYKKQHNKFADNIALLSDGHDLLDSTGQELTCDIFINRHGRGYVMEVKDLKNQITVILDNFGHYTINYE